MHKMWKDTALHFAPCLQIVLLSARSQLMDSTFMYARDTASDAL